MNYRNHVIKYIFATTSKPQEFKHKFCRFYTVNSYSLELDLRPKIMILCMSFICQVTEAVWKQAPQRGRITLHCSRKKLQLCMNPQPKQYFLPYKLFFTDQLNAFETSICHAVATLHSISHIILIMQLNEIN